MISEHTSAELVSSDVITHTAPGHAEQSFLRNPPITWPSAIPSKSANPTSDSDGVLPDECPNKLSDVGMHPCLTLTLRCGPWECGVRGSVRAHGRSVVVLAEYLRGGTQA